MALMDVKWPAPVLDTPDPVNELDQILEKLVSNMLRRCGLHRCWSGGSTGWCSQAVFVMVARAADPSQSGAD